MPKSIKFTPLEKATDFIRRLLPYKVDGGLKSPSAQTVREQSSLTGLTIIFGIIITVVLLTGSFLRQQYVVPILMYHSISPAALAENRLAVKADTFDRQMRFLKSHRYNVIPLEALVGLIKNKKKIPAKTICISSDDGYRDNYTYAFPILKKYNLPAAMFIIVSEVGRPQGDRLSWDEIKEMQDSGLITFGSHSLGPEPLINFKAEAQIKRQIFDSKKILEEKLGRKVEFFSYPEGMFDSRIKQLVIAAGYSGAVATNPGKDYADDDVFLLKRLRISENSANMFIFAVESSGFYTFLKEYKKERKQRRHGKK